MLKLLNVCVWYIFLLDIPKLILTKNLYVLDINYMHVLDFYLLIFVIIKFMCHGVNIMNISVYALWVLCHA